jgi:soluble lytic murein transglycosylase-like protein
MKTKLQYVIFSLILFFRIGFADARDVSPHSWNPPDVYTLVETLRSSDSSEASDVFLVPFRSEIDSTARKYKLPPALLAAFIQEESQFDPFAIRTEPSYLKKQKVIAQARAFSRAHNYIPTFHTELVLRSSSIGLMQPLGQVAREQGFIKPYLTELIKPYASLDEGAKHLLSKMKRYGRDTLSAISAYNQGNNRKKRGVFENARYVYRVAVAWRVYEALFTGEAG